MYKVYIPYFSGYKAHLKSSDSSKNRMCALSMDQVVLYAQALNQFYVTNSAIYLQLQYLPVIVV